MPIGFATEKDGPEFANGIVGMRFGAKERIPDPKG